MTTLLFRQKQIVVISILAHAINQKCNALQAVIGIFLHATNTSETTIKTFARLGLSIALSSIHRGVRSLSVKALHTVEEFAQTLIAAWAYDNFDINFRRTIPTIEQARESLVHLTSGLVFKMQHGVTPEDLRVSAELWKTSPFNEQRDRNIPVRTVTDLINLHPDTQYEVDKMSREARFNAWKFRETLVHHGPVYFHTFRDRPGEPDVIEQIPITKLDHVPVKSMDINQSKVSGNKDAIKDMLGQGGIGAPEDDMEDGEVDISEFVVPIHGDLGTGDRIWSLQERRAIEETPYERFQHVVFVPGAFHQLMAAEDSIFRLLLLPKSIQLDESSFKHFAGRLRPGDTLKMNSKKNPGHRFMHDLIKDVGAVLRLDSWRVAAKKENSRWISLEEWAKSTPDWETVVRVSKTLVNDQVAGGAVDMFAAQNLPHKVRDGQYENTQLTHKYLLLYEHLDFAMKQGDIGRFEVMLVRWIHLWKGTGKHKYATTMERWLCDVHFRYPAGLKCVVLPLLLSAVDISPHDLDTQSATTFWLIQLVVEGLSEQWIGSWNSTTCSQRSVAFLSATETCR